MACRRAGGMHFFVVVLLLEKSSMKTTNPNAKTCSAAVFRAVMRRNLRIRFMDIPQWLPVGHFENGDGCSKFLQGFLEFG